jgi:superfamily I DNA/RNA helicase
MDRLEEERRLCYVAITRAQTRVCFLRTKQRTLFGSIQYNQPSLF